jgi:cytoskeleton protein RodZ
MQDKEDTGAAGGTASVDINSIGGPLRRGREYLGLTRPQMAERLHLDTVIIAALEEERFAALGAPVFVRGHLRRYAQALNLDAEDLQRRYEGQQPAGNAPDLSRAPRALAQPDPRRFLWPAVIAAGLAVLGGILWWALSAPPAP